MTLLARIQGCLIAGAAGDALGAPIEFTRDRKIRAQFGPEGLCDFVPAYGLLGAITDDTQMTLFTVEGLVRALVRGREKGIGSTCSVVHHAHLRWLITQGGTAPALDKGADGWLIRERRLHAHRAPGNTCLSGLRAVKRFGDFAQNDSKGCGGVMRSAPFGFMPVSPEQVLPSLGEGWIAEEALALAAAAALATQIRSPASASRRERRRRYRTNMMPETHRERASYEGLPPSVFTATQVSTPDVGAA